MTVPWSEMEGAQNSETGNLEQALKFLFLPAQSETNLVASLPPALSLLSENKTGATGTNICWINWENLIDFSKGRSNSYKNCSSGTWADIKVS